MYRDDAAAYVLGAMRGAEAQAFERLLAADVTLQREVGELREATALLAWAAPTATPPDTLRSRIAAPRAP
jgi:anti-sigma-K factor RskA